MVSFGSVSELALGQAPNITAVNLSLQRVAQARVADPIVFFELVGRRNDVTTLEEIISEVPDSGLTPVSALPVSARFLPRVRRVTRSFLFSTRPWCGAPTDALRPNERAIPRVITAGRISRSIPIDSSVQRRGQRTIGDAQLANPDGRLDDLLTSYSFVGERVRVWLGEPEGDAGDWALVYEATVESVEATRKDLRIGISTVADQLERPYQLRRYTGGGGLSGDASVAGRLKPIGMGEIWGAEPVRISEADNIWQVNDGKIESFDWVSEGGVNFAFTQDYPNYDSLKFATVALGQYATCRAEGCFKPGLSAEGLVFPLRVGFRGDASGSGYVSSTGDILYRIARDRAFLGAAQLDLDSFNSLPAARVGYYFDGSRSVTVASVFDKLLRAVVGTYGVGRGSVVSVQRLLPPRFALTNLALRADQTFDQRVELRPYSLRDRQPYTYAPTASPVAINDVSPLADAAVARRLVAGSLDGAISTQSDVPVPPTVQEPLPTFFVEEEPAKRVAEAALSFASTNSLPLRADLGRLGLLAQLGQVVALDSARFAENYRGLVYQQEDNLSAAVTSRVVTLG